MPGQSLLFGAPRRRRALVAVVAALAVVGTLGAPAWADGGQGSGQSSTAQQGSSTQQGSSAGGTNQQNQGSDAAAGPSDRQARADEQQFLQLANQTRAQQGAQPLVADGGLAAIARWWAGNMASADDIFHNMKLPDDVTAAVTPDWEKLGENVGKGQDVPQL